MLNVTHLTKTYPGGQQALRGIDLNIERVGMFGLLGPTGKTTFMRILAEMFSRMPTAGDIHIFGHDVITQAGAASLCASRDRLSAAGFAAVSEPSAPTNFWTTWQFSRA